MNDSILIKSSWLDKDIKKDLILIFLFWVLAIILINPIGDFPLNDDWSWGRTARIFIQTGKFQPTGWTPMTLITNVLWGALFCLPFGFSFTALRISTLFISLVGIVALYLFLSKSNYPRQIRWAVSLTLLANPLYFSLSYTFMTDVPFTVFATMALVFLLGSLRSDSYACLFGGTVLACLAILSRQIGLFIIFSFFPVYLMRFGFSLRNFFRAIMPILFGVGSLIGFQYWLKKSSGLPGWYNFKFNDFLYSLRFPKQLFNQFLHNSFLILIYLGIFLLPLLLVLFSNVIKRIPRKRIVIYILIFLTFAFWASRITIFNGRAMPMHYNVLIRGGIGPLTLYDSYFLPSSVFGKLPSFFWGFATALAICGAGLLVIFVFEAVLNFISGGPNGSDPDRKPKQVFLALCSLGYFLPLALTGFFDRHLIPLIVSLSLLIVFSVVREKVVVKSLLSALGFSVLFIFVLYSLLGTHDYLSWNRARWEALHYLNQEMNVSPASIDGGFEFNGFYLFSPEYIPSVEKSWWWVNRNDYLIAFGSVPKYTIERKYEFNKWLLPGKGNILILKKTER